MTNIMFVLASAVTLFVVGVLIGLGLHTQGIDRKYREVSQLVRGLNDRQDAMPKGTYSREMREKYASTGSVLRPWPVEDTRARAESFAGTPTTASPAATRRWARC